MVIVMGVGDGDYGDSDGCGCGDGDRERVEHYRNTRQQCRELTHNKLDLVIMGQLMSVTQKESMTEAHKHVHKERERSCTLFRHEGHHICFLHNIGRGKFQAIKTSLRGMASDPESDHIQSLSLS